MSQSQVASNELIVEGKYFIYVEPSEEDLKNLKTLMAKILMNEGYVTEDRIHPQFPDLTNPRRAMDFRLKFEKRSVSLKLKLKRLLRLVSKKEIEDQKYFNRLGEIRDDLPFRVELRFRTISDDKREGYEIEISTVPTILQKRKQGLTKKVPRNRIDDTINTNKQFLNRVMSNLEAEVLLEPQTPAEVTKNSLNSDKRAMFEKIEYGNKVITHIDEGDTCLRSDLLRSALNSYVHAIEWTIICYLNKKEDIDIIKKEKNGNLYYFSDLVEELEENTDISQKTFRKLKNMNSSERRWISHHKTGNIVESDVANVKERFEILVEELF